eukprot:6098707-Pleurochrysis_carterae.AAC.1
MRRLEGNCESVSNSGNVRDRNSIEQRGTRPSPRALRASRRGWPCASPAAPSPPPCASPAWSP